MLDQLRKLQRQLQEEKLKSFKRRVSFGDLVTDRWENAKQFGFGEGASCYDNVLVIGDVAVGKNTWIGPNVILDGSGGPLVIGDYCSVSAGVQIYTHNTVNWSVTLGKAEHAKAATSIGNGVYLGPNCIISMGVRIGDKAVIGAMTFVNIDVPGEKKALGIPARIVGDVDIE